jgi:AhpD family alkylhydroperoxidase
VVFSSFLPRGRHREQNQEKEKPFSSIKKPEEEEMDKPNRGKTYQDISKRYPEVIKSLETLGTAVRAAGPLDEKTSHLIQLAAAAAARSEGSVHSHTKRAIKAGASADEIYHTLIVLISTIGFPQAMAAISWSRDILEEGED